MDQHPENQLSEQAANMVENLAIRVAERQAGLLTPNHLAPYLPMSLGLIQDCLDGLVDDASVLADRGRAVPQYEFSAYREKNPGKGLLKVKDCVACDTDLPKKSTDVFCLDCRNALQNELNRLAETMGWPAQAVYEHELLYLAAQHNDPPRAEDLAGRSRYTLRNVRGKLTTMGHDGYIQKEFDDRAGLVVYQFPKIEYPRDRYRANMAVIRSHPASVMEEVQTRIAQILIALGALVLALFILAFLHVPFPLLLLALFVAGPILALAIWRHKSPPADT